MSPTENLTPCIGCGALVPVVEQSTNPPGASPGCYALYTEVLAREYSDYRYAAVHNLTVDAYSLQHPGLPSPRTIKSAAVHLISLYLQLEHDLDSMAAARAKQAAVEHHDRFIWLEPPASLGEMTILDVHAAADPGEHKMVVSQWAAGVWQAWQAHHATVRDWAALSGLLS